jgi:hypothetical protein
MGKAKQNANQSQMGNVATCVACGEAIDPKWAACPYCGTTQGAEAAPSKPGLAPPTGVAGAHIEPESKTVSININELQAGKKRELVGWLVALNGNHRGEDFKIFDGKNLLGTAADCDIVITDPYLSAKHCTIKHENGNFVLIDLDSTNGTYVNQKRVTKMELIDNDTVRLGRTEFKFKSLF